MKVLSVLALILSFIFMMETAWPHSYHQSFTEVELGMSGTLEVIIKVNSSDIVKVSDTEEDLIMYLEENLRFTQEENSSELNIIGTELKGRFTEIYVEVEFEQDIESLKGLSIMNTLFFEHNDHQVNQMAFRDGEERFSNFTSSERRKRNVKID